MSTIKWYNYWKGFGFITPKDGSPDVFFHQNAISSKKPLQRGDEVDFFTMGQENKAFIV